MKRSIALLLAAVMIFGIIPVSFLTATAHGTGVGMNKVENLSLDQAPSQKIPATVTVDGIADDTAWADTQWNYADISHGTWDTTPVLDPDFEYKYQMNIDYVNLYGVIVADRKLLKKGTLEQFTIWLNDGTSDTHYTFKSIFYIDESRTDNVRCERYVMEKQKDASGNVQFTGRLIQIEEPETANKLLEEHTHIASIDDNVVTLEFKIPLSEITGQDPNDDTTTTANLSAYVSAMIVRGEGNEKIVNRLYHPLTTATTNSVENWNPEESWPKNVVTISLGDLYNTDSYNADYSKVMPSPISVDGYLDEYTWSMLTTKESTHYTNYQYYNANYDEVFSAASLEGNYSAFHFVFDSDGGRYTSSKYENYVSKGVADGTDGTLYENFVDSKIRFKYELNSNGDSLYGGILAYADYKDNDLYQHNEFDENDTENKNQTITFFRIMLADGNNYSGGSIGSGSPYMLGSIVLQHSMDKGGESYGVGAQTNSALALNGNFADDADEQIQMKAIRTDRYNIGCEFMIPYSAIKHTSVTGASYKSGQPFEAGDQICVIIEVATVSSTSWQDEPTLTSGYLVNPSNAKTGYMARSKGWFAQKLKDPVTNRDIDVNYKLAEKDSNVWTFAACDGALTYQYTPTLVTADKYINTSWRNASYADMLSPADYVPIRSYRTEIFSDYEYIYGAVLIQTERGGDLADSQFRLWVNNGNPTADDTFDYVVNFRPEYTGKTDDYGNKIYNIIRNVTINNTSEQAHNYPTWHHSSTDIEKSTVDAAIRVINNTGEYDFDIEDGAEIAILEFAIPLEAVGVTELKTDNINDLQFSYFTSFERQSNASDGTYPSLYGIVYPSVDNQAIQAKAVQQRTVFNTNSANGEFTETVWGIDGWTEIDKYNGKGQTGSGTDISGRFNFITDSGRLYLAAVIDRTATTVPVNTTSSLHGAGTTVRIWLRTHGTDGTSSATKYNKLYEIALGDDGTSAVVRHISVGASTEYYYKVPKNSSAEIIQSDGSNYGNNNRSELIAAVKTAGGKTYFEFSIPAWCFGGGYGFDYYVQISDHANGTDSLLLYPNASDHPYSVWDTACDLTVSKEALDKNRYNQNLMFVEEQLYPNIWRNGNTQTIRIQACNRTNFIDIDGKLEEAYWDEEEELTWVNSESGSWESTPNESHIFDYGYRVYVGNEYIYGAAKINTTAAEGQSLEFTLWTNKNSNTKADACFHIVYEDGAAKCYSDKAHQNEVSFDYEMRGNTYKTGAFAVKTINNVTQIEFMFDLEKFNIVDHYTTPTDYPEFYEVDGDIFYTAKRKGFEYCVSVTKKCGLEGEPHENTLMHPDYSYARETLYLTHINDYSDNYASLVQSICTVSASSPAITADVGEEVSLARYIVQFKTGVSGVGQTEWYSDAACTQRINTFKYDQVGSTKIYAKNPNSPEEIKTVWFVTKNGAGEYVIYERSFENTTVAQLQSEGYRLSGAGSVTYDAGENAILMDSVMPNNQYASEYLFLPVEYDVFGDVGLKADILFKDVYTYASDTYYNGSDYNTTGGDGYTLYANAGTQDTSRWFAIAFRYSGDTKYTHGKVSYDTKDTFKGAWGIEYTEATTLHKSGWNWVGKAKSEIENAMCHYGEQDATYNELYISTFGSYGEVSIDGTKYVDVTPETYAASNCSTRTNDNETGSIFLRTCGSSVYVKNIKLVVQPAILTGISTAASLAAEDAGSKSPASGVGYVLFAPTDYSHVFKVQYKASTTEEILRLIALQNEIEGSFIYRLQGSAIKSGSSGEHCFENDLLLNHYVRFFGFDETTDFGDGKPTLALNLFKDNTSVRDFTVRGWYSTVQYEVYENLTYEWITYADAKFPHLVDWNDETHAEININDQHDFHTDRWNVPNAYKINALDYYIPEKIYIDGDLSDSGWDDSKWIYVSNEVNGNLQNKHSDTAVDVTEGYKYQVRTDGDYFYLAAVVYTPIDAVKTQDGSSPFYSTPKLRLWIKSEDEDTTYTYTDADGKKQEGTYMLADETVTTLKDSAISFTHLYDISAMIDNGGETNPVSGGTGTGDLQEWSVKVDRYMYTPESYVTWVPDDAEHIGTDEITRVDTAEGKVYYNGIVLRHAYHVNGFYDPFGGAARVKGENVEYTVENHDSEFFGYTTLIEENTVSGEATQAYNNVSWYARPEVTAYVYGNEHASMTSSPDGMQTYFEMKFPLSEIGCDDGDEFEYVLQAGTEGVTTDDGYVLFNPPIVRDFDHTGLKAYLDRLPYWIWPATAQRVDAKFIEQHMLRNPREPVTPIGSQVWRNGKDEDGNDVFLYDLGDGQQEYLAMRFGVMYDSDYVNLPNVKGVYENATYWDVKEIGMLIGYADSITGNVSNLNCDNVDNYNIYRVESDDILNEIHGTCMADYESYIFYAIKLMWPDYDESTLLAYRGFVEYYPSDQQYYNKAADVFADKSTYSSENGHYVGKPLETFGVSDPKNIPATWTYRPTFYSDTMIRSYNMLLNAIEEASEGQSNLPGAAVETPAPEANGTKVVYVPLDQRPINVDRLQYQASAAGFELIMPPEELYYNMTKPDVAGVDVENNAQTGDSAAILNWLKTDAATQGANYYLLSLDMLFSGGLLASRSPFYDTNGKSIANPNIPTYTIDQETGYITQDHVYTLSAKEEEVVAYLQSLAADESKTVVCFDTVMRLACSGGYYDLTLNEYTALRGYGKWARPQLTGSDLTIEKIMSVANLTTDTDDPISTPVENDEISLYNKENKENYTISDKHFQDYLAARERKLRIADAVYPYLTGANGSKGISEFYVGFDDSSPETTIQTNEGNYIKQFLIKNDPDTLIFAGADELAMMGLSYITTEIYGSVSVSVKYYGGGKDKPADAYDIGTLHSTVINHVAGAGATYAYNKTGDLELLVFSNPTSDVDIQAEKTALINQAKANFAAGIPTCIVDAGGGGSVYDNKLHRDILDSGIAIGELMCYSNWNTSANAIGTGLSNAVSRLTYLKNSALITEQSNEGFMKVLAHAWVKDVAYQAINNKPWPGNSTQKSYVHPETTDYKTAYNEYLDSAEEVLSKLNASDIYSGRDENGKLTKDNKYNASVSNLNYPLDRAFEATFDVEVTTNGILPTVPDYSDNKVSVISVGKTYTVTPDSTFDNDTTYPDTNGLELTDGEIGTGYSYTDAKWSGYDFLNGTGRYFDVVIDLGTVSEIHQVILNVAMKGEYGIKAPAKLELYTSVDGSAYTLQRTAYDNGDASAATKDMILIPFCETVDGRFVKVRIYNSGWTFLSEVSVVGTTNDRTNLALGKSYTISEQWYDVSSETTPRYPDRDSNGVSIYESGNPGVSLTNGIINSGNMASIYNQNWVGFWAIKMDGTSGGHHDVIIDLGDLCEIDQVNAYAAAISGVGWPYKVQCYVSTDASGDSWTSVGVNASPAEKPAKEGSHAITVSFEKKLARRVNVVVSSYGWTFLSEVEVYGKPVARLAVESYAVDMTRAHTNYPDDGSKLTDGVTMSNGTVSLWKPMIWSGWSLTNGQDFDIDLTLENTSTLTAVKAYCGGGGDGAIYAPASIEVYYSTDGIDYTELSGSCTVTPDDGDPLKGASDPKEDKQYVYTFTASEIENAKYVRVKIKGVRGYFWCNEIEAYGISG